MCRKESPNTVIIDVINKINISGPVQVIDLGCAEGSVLRHTHLRAPKKVDVDCYGVDLVLPEHVPDGVRVEQMCALQCCKHLAEDSDPSSHLVIFCATQLFPSKLVLALTHAIHKISGWKSITCISMRVFGSEIHCLSEKYAAGHIDYLHSWNGTGEKIEVTYVWFHRTKI